MNWKLSKNRIASKGLDENDFIIGLDIGNATSTIAYFDTNSGQPEIIDLSGGYGKQSIPTVMQYIPESKEWVYGEYAVLNKGFGGEITVRAFIDKLGSREYVEIEKKPVSYSNILSLYVKELIGNIYSINPKAQIAGIIVAIPEYLSEEARDELMLVLNASGYGKEIIDLVSDKECIFHSHYLKREIKREKILILDFGGRELRGGVYEVVPEHGNATAKCLSMFFDRSLGMEMIDNEVSQLFLKYYLEEVSVGRERHQLTELIDAFSYQHKDLLFQKINRNIRLYYNFTYPPFQKIIEKDEVDALVLPYRRKLNKFLENILKRVGLNNISAVICTGGGFEMIWAREEIDKNFKNSFVSINKNPKGVIAYGACAAAAQRLSVLDGARFNIKDSHQINADIGLITGKNGRFVPLVERNSFWWQEHPAKTFIVMDETNKPIDIELYRRDRNGDTHIIDRLMIEGLPSRPRGTTKLNIYLKYEDYGKLTATIKDYGFGEMYAAGGYEKIFEVNAIELG